MPTIEEADAAAGSYVLPKNWDKHQLLWLVNSLWTNPTGYELPRRWANAPNWEPDRILRGISRATWDRNAPPLKFLGFSEQWIGLPADLVRYVFLEGKLPPSPFNKKTTSMWLRELAWAHRTRHRHRLLFKDPVHWFWLSTPESWPIRKHIKTEYVPRTLVVAEWLINTATSKAWLKPRIAHGVGGVQREFRFIDLIDEVWDMDIPHPKASVEKVFDRLHERISDENLSRIAQQTQPLNRWPSHWPTLLQGMFHLNTGREIVAEGNRMQHCVGGYVQGVAQGQCYILSIRTSAGDSTVELSPSRSVVQHRGFENKTPPHTNDRLLQKWLGMS